MFVVFLCDFRMMSSKKVMICAVFFVSLFLLSSLAVVASGTSSTKTVIPNLAPVRIGAHSMTIASAPTTVDCTKAPYCVYVTDLSSDDLQVIQGSRFVGEISISGVTIGAAYDPNNEMVYVGGYSCECVYVINAKTEVVSASINISSYGPASAVVYSTTSKMIYAATYSDPGYYMVIDPSTNKIVTAISACGYYPEFGDQLNKGNVYFASLESSSSYGCVNAINPITNKIVATARLSDDYAIGVAVNSGNKEVYVNGELCQCVYIFTSALKKVTTLKIGSYLWGSWSNDRLQTVYVAPGIYPIYKNNTVGAPIPVGGGDTGCGLGKENYVPFYSSGGVVALIKNNQVVKDIQTDGTDLFGCTATVES